MFYFACSHNLLEGTGNSAPFHIITITEVLSTGDSSQKDKQMRDVNTIGIEEAPFLSPPLLVISISNSRCFASEFHVHFHAIISLHVCVCVAESGVARGIAQVYPTLSSKTLGQDKSNDSVSTQKVSIRMPKTNEDSVSPQNILIRMPKSKCASIHQQQGTLLH